MSDEFHILFQIKPPNTLWYFPPLLITMKTFINNTQTGALKNCLSFFFILILFHIGEKAFETSGNVAHEFGQDVRSFYGNGSAVHVHTDAFERRTSLCCAFPFLPLFFSSAVHDDAGRVFCHSTNSSSSTGPGRADLNVSVFKKKHTRV